MSCKLALGIYSDNLVFHEVCVPHIDKSVSARKIKYFCQDSRYKVSGGLKPSSTSFSNPGLINALSTHIMMENSPVTQVTTSLATCVYMIHQVFGITILSHLSQVSIHTL